MQRWSNVAYNFWTLKNIFLKAPSQIIQTNRFNNVDLATLTNSDIVEL